VLEYITWGGGGLGDPLTRPAHIVAREVHRRLVTFSGAKQNYGVVVTPDFRVDEAQTQALRREMARRRERVDADETGKASTNAHPEKRQGGTAVGYDRGGTMSELIQRCKQDTGLDPPRPQWERDPYGPHTGLPYVQEWYRRMRVEGMRGWDCI
jgi:5-oxoprolinase (ATP-hydrolysing)